MLGFTRCLFHPHVPDRQRVTKLANEVYLANCLFCGCRLRRRARNIWVRDWQRQLRLTDGRRNK